MLANHESPLRIMIVDDSAVVRGLWAKALGQEREFQVVGMAENGRRALEQIPNLKPDLVLLDIEMPEMDGLTALPLLLAACPGVRVIMASSLTHQSSSATVQALAFGAADYIHKPSTSSLGVSAGELYAELIRKIKALKYPTRTKADALRRKLPESTRPHRLGRTRPPKVIVVGCSTGGPNALCTVLRGVDFSYVQQPIVVVQHMPAYFLALLAERVGTETGRKCVVIKGGESLVPGFIGIAPGDYHVEVSSFDPPVLQLNRNPPENFCRPAVDPLFRSAAAVFGADVLAIVLTGMGEDGRRGCEEVRRWGGLVIAQDEETSVVWGMPGAVVGAGLADHVLPVEQIAAAIKEICVYNGRAA